MTTATYLTTSLPYVNADPHLGHALEFVQADVIARHARARGHQIRLLSGTDDNAIKNVRAAEAAGVPTEAFVVRNSERFRRLIDILGVRIDDWISTGSDPRHRARVEDLWCAAEAAGDLYRRSYRGRYCIGCEQFYTDAELIGGLCPEHRIAVPEVVEQNWFFRLSRYTDRIEAALAHGEVRIEPAERAAEALAVVRSGLVDISVSRPRQRSVGWGIGVPGDPDQVIYVWWDALAGYLSALGPDVSPRRRWWQESERRVHLIGKGILRFHAVYWLGLLLSTRQRLPTDIWVHEYLTAGGQKLAKTGGVRIDPFELVDRVGLDAVRWWLIRDVGRRNDTDVSVERIVERYRTDLAGGIGNVVNRVIRLVAQARGAGLDTSSAIGSPLVAGLALVRDRIDAAVECYDLRSAAEAILAGVAVANRRLEQTAPWLLAARERRTGAVEPELDRVLAELIAFCRGLATELAIITPDGAARLLDRLGTDAPTGPAAVPAFPQQFKLA